VSTELQEKQWAFDSRQEAQDLAELTNEALEQREMLQDDGKRQYTCSSTACGYDGDQHCQNCGFASGEAAICPVCHEPFQEGLPCACDRRD
jgi:hypothetical protein